MADVYKLLALWAAWEASELISIEEIQLENLGLLGHYLLKYEVFFFDIYIHFSYMKTMKLDINAL